MKKNPASLDPRVDVRAETTPNPPPTPGQPASSVREPRDPVKRTSGRARAIGWYLRPVAEVKLRLIPDPGSVPPAKPTPVVSVNPYTSMTPRFGRTATLFGRRFFAHFDFEANDADRLVDLDRRGAVVYVMRYSSRLDYFLFNWLFLLRGIRLSAFANGIKFFYYRPFSEALRLLGQGLLERLRRGAGGMREASIQQIRQCVREGGSAFLFLRTDKIRTRVRSKRGALREGRTELDYLREVVDTTFASEVPISLVPLALFWRKGARPERPFLNLFYGGNERPTDIGKVVAFIWNYRNLALRVGQPIDLRAFVDQNRASGRERVVKQVRRSLLIFLRREEKPVVGAPLPSFARIQEAVLDDGEVQRVIAEVAAAKKRRPRASKRAREGLVGDRRVAERDRARGARGAGRAAVQAAVRADRRARTRARGRGGEAAPAGARAESPLALRLPDPVVALLPEPPGAAAGRRRHQPVVLAARADLPRAPARSSCAAASTAIRSTARCSAATCST